MKKIFLIEDDEVLRNELVRILELQGFEVLCCTDFLQADTEACEQCADVVIVDLKLPETDGHTICRNIRTQSDVPILVLTSSDIEFDEVMSMKLGADDYITKPYSPAVLLAHIERLLQRAGKEGLPRLEWKGLTLDISKSMASYGEKSVELSRNELRILTSLMRAQGSIVSRYDLMYDLWQSDEFIDDNTLTVNVNRLRKTLVDIGMPYELLKTHRGQGYSLCQLPNS